MAYLEFKPTSPLYYYTDANGFEGIVRSKKLWLSDIKASNDPRELALGQKILSEAVEVYNSDDIRGVSKRDMAEFLSDLLSFQRHSTYYACCFGLAGDELPLWREYGGGGTGGSIGFRPTAVSSIPGRMQLVRYAEDDIADFFKPL